MIEEWKSGEVKRWQDLRLAYIYFLFVYHHSKTGLNFKPGVPRVFVVLRVSTEFDKPIYTISGDAAANGYEQSCHVQCDSGFLPQPKINGV
jgi:hypothetical protein